MWSGLTSGITSGTSRCILSALELVTTAHPAAAKRGSISAAIEASSAAKMIFGAPSDVAGDTRISATRAGKGVFILQRAASPYKRPSERSEAASHATSNHGWCSSICTKRCPTIPVAPRIPTAVFVGIGDWILQQPRWMPGVRHPPSVIRRITTVNSIRADGTNRGVNMPELRQNYFTKEWVIIATERAKRPEELATHRPAQSLPPFVETCPFCPGNESKTPPEIMRFPANASQPWAVRVIPNKFAALSREAQPARSQQDVWRRIEGFGFHEVVIDSPDHSCCMALLPDEQVASILRVYKERYTLLSMDRRVNHVTIFKNHGVDAG